MREIEVGRVEEVEAQNVYRIHVSGSPIEIARALENIRKTHGLSYSEMTKVTPFSKGQISKYLSLLRLEPELIAKLENGEMAWSTGYVLSKMEPETRRPFISQDEDRITLKKAEEAKREANISQLYGLFKNIETISQSVTSNMVCPHCGKVI